MNFSPRLSWIFLNLLAGFAIAGSGGFVGCSQVLAEENSPPTVPSFRNEVMAALSKADCNQGACHGNARGKGGFQLSLRGQDPANDFLAVVKEWSGRRINVLEPDASLLLEKPLMQVPHEGGRKLVAGSPEHRILRDWIAAGTPPDAADAPKLQSIKVTPDHIDLLVTDLATARLPLNVKATFSNGQILDVTRLTVFEPSLPVVEVTPEGLAIIREYGAFAVVARYLDQQFTVPVAVFPRQSAEQQPAQAGISDRKVHSPIDEIVFRRLKSLQIEPSPECDDATFLRRVTLDMIGLLPTAAEAQAFVANTDPDKRDRWIEALAQRPEFADWWALKWCDLLRIEEKTLDLKGVAAFHQWVRDSILKNQPQDEFVRELLASEGSTYTVPATNYYRALRDPATRAEATAQVFLGIRLQCAKCHNHPFDQWSQNNYYEWSNVFAQVDYKIIENKRRDTNDTHEFDGEQIVELKLKSQFNDPRTGKPRSPQLLALAEEPLAVEENRLKPMAAWLAHPENERFIDVMVNRVWSQMLGRGIVEPVDDFRATNPPSHPELLAWLRREFVAHHCDLRWLVQTIARSGVYQTSHVVLPANEKDEVFFSRAIVRRLSAEQLLDGISQACEVTPRFADHPEIKRAQGLPGVQAMAFRRGKSTTADKFLRQFGRPQRLQSCDCERTTETTLTQTFQLIGGKLLQESMDAKGNVLQRLAASDLPSEAIVSELYWRTISRGPLPAELTVHLQHLEQAANRREGLEDILWALLNSDEFLLRH